MSPTPYGIGIANANGGNVNINNSFVDIYDIETGYWFRQTTFGNKTKPLLSGDFSFMSTQVCRISRLEDRISVQCWSVQKTAVLIIST